MIKLGRWLLPVVVLLSALSKNDAANPYEPLLSRVPENANVVFVFNNEALQKSPLAMREEWGKNYKKTALGGMFGTAPHLLRAVMAAQINHATLENDWEVAICKLLYDVKMKDLTKAVQGSRDSIGGREVTLTPQNSFIVPFTGTELGVMRPASRQTTGRWIRTSGLGRGTISPFLSNAVDNMGSTAQAMIAFDLDEVCDADGLRHRLGKCKSMAGAKVELEAAVKLFTGLKGLTISLNVDESIKGELRLHFEASPTFLQPVAKKLLNEALAGMGAAIDDFNDWGVSVDGNAIVMRGALTTASARKIVSPLFRPIPMVVGDGNKEDQSVADSKLVCSQRYFSAVNGLIDDLKDAKTRGNNDRSFWQKQFADKIDALPVLNVDEDLLKFGAAVSTTFRSLANLATNTENQRRAIALNTYEYSTVVPGGSYYYGNGAGWGYGYSMPYNATYSNYAQNQNQLSKVGNTEAALRGNTWKNIEAAAIDIRQKMSQKYGAEFK